jgi:predicted permease
MRELRFALRVLASRPAFTLVAAISLALGIGANSAIFSFVDAYWFRPPNIPDPGRIVRVFGVTNQDRRAELSYPEFLDLQKAPAFQDVVAYGGRGLTLVEGDTRELRTLNVTSTNYFTGLGVKPALGRVYTPRDPQDQMVVVLGDSIWRQHYGSDPSIVGRQIHLVRSKDLLVTVIGVLPASFRGINNTSDRDFWFPDTMWPVLGDEKELQRRDNRWFRVVARLAPGATVESANAQVQAIAQRMAGASPSTNRDRRAAVISDAAYRFESAGSNPFALLSIVALVVLISSVNVANLLLSRAGARGTEMAIRLAIGAGRARLIRQLMIENIVLGLFGLTLGLAFGAAITAVLPSLIIQPPGFFIPIDFQFDSRVVIFSVAVSLLTIVLFGLAPAWKSARPDLLPALKGEAAFAGTGRRWPLRNWLAVAQIGVSLTLVACAGVLARSFLNTRTSDLGFGRKPLLLVWLTSKANPAEYRDVISHFQSLPGVRSVAAAIRAPLSLSSNGMFQRVTFPGRPEFANKPPFEIKYNSVTANFLSTMGTPILRGRGFDRSDEIEGATSVLINERMAQQFFPGQDPVNKTIRVGRRDHTIIGVVRNSPINDIGEPAEPYLYLAFWPNFEREVTFLIETEGDPNALAQAARGELKVVDRNLDPLGITTENELIRFSAQMYQITAEIAGMLGTLGLILTAVGLYGVIAFGVSLRTRELGIRMALGAGRGDTLSLVLRDVGIIGVAGVAFGLPIALIATRLLRSMLFGVGPWDPLAFAAGAFLVIAILLLAGLKPALRATGIQPSSALRMM